MSTAEFRRHGHDVIDWIADYYDNVDSYPVLSQVEPGDIRARLPAHPPLKGEPFEAILADVTDTIMPGITHWQSPNFFAFFPANTSGPSILGELLSAGLGVQGMLWATSPACTELETHVLDWIAEILSLPQEFRSDSTGGGVIQDSASSAALCALLAARERKSEFAINELGANGKLVAYCSTEAHSSIDKAMAIAGIGRKNLRKIKSDAAFAMDAVMLAAQIDKDLELGLTPFFVCATVGTTSSNAIDPVRQIGEICQQHHLWLHVDAAMAGSAAMCPEHAYLHDGLDLADSYCFNPHKWMFTNFDCDCFFVRDRQILIDTLSVLPEYLRNSASDSGTVIDYRDWQISLGRRFRALKLWFVIRHYGIEGLQFHIRKHIELAQIFARWVVESPAFELVVTAPLNLVCFRYVSTDLENNEINKRILERLNQSGDLYLTHTVLDEKFTLRFCVGQASTELAHVEKAWANILHAAQSVENE